MVLVQFTPFASTVSPAFWHTLSRVKLEVQKLSSDALPIVASYRAGRTFRDRETGVDVSLPSALSLAEDAFNPADQVRLSPGVSISRGHFKNFNTIEEFKASDKQQLFNALCDEVCCLVVLGARPGELTPYLDVGSYERPGDRPIRGPDALLTHHFRGSQEVQVLLLVCFPGIRLEAALGNRK